MNAQAKYTPGPWQLMKAGTDECGDEHCFDYVRVAKGRVITAEGRSSDEANANAALIAEAGTVAHETGFTPRQLAEQWKELMEALAALLHDIGSTGCDHCDCEEWKSTVAASAALAHARGETP